ncbi:MAG: 2-succinyl-5-enolpyruvyl-6-hydroxy-3-cyclohexene-1-carboxylic-acid synthase [Nocardioidaceae bacterium]
MNASTALARLLVDELVRGGVRDAVLAPGSRSAPLALALHDADREGRLRLHVRIDERSAGFLALGLSKGSHRPVPVLTTSGTAVANLHPAVLEADAAGVPLVVLSADRPAAVRGTGANQTTDQVGLFSTAVRLAADWPASAAGPGDGRAVRALVCRALAAATGSRTRGPGPVQLNLQLDDPLLPDEAPAGWPVGRDDGAPWTAVDQRPPVEPNPLVLGPRTVVLAGDGAGPPARILAERAGWPLLAEPSSGSRTGRSPIGAYRLLLAAAHLGGAVQRVLVHGHPTLSRPVTRLLSRADVEVVVVSGGGSWPDVSHRASRVATAVTAEPDEANAGWTAAWHEADAAAGQAIEALLADQRGLVPHDVARAVSAAVPPAGLLVVGSSNPIRDLDLMAVAPPVGERRMVMANRGLSGIDGTVSTAVGAALGRDSSRALAYLGDLAFLHDVNGLLVGPGEPRPDLTIVVANDDGGSIFATLEQGAPEHARSFERVFGTPTGADLGSLCRAYDVRHRWVDEPAALKSALREQPVGIEVVEARVDRTHRRELESQLAVAVRQAVATVAPVAADP